MRLNLGTIEVSDEVRKFIRRDAGRSGLATREECRRWLVSHAYADLEAAMAHEQEYLRQRAQEEGV